MRAHGFARFSLFAVDPPNCCVFSDEMHALPNGLVAVLEGQALSWVGDDAASPAGGPTGTAVIESVTRGIAASRGGYVYVDNGVEILQWDSLDLSNSATSAPHVHGFTLAER